MIRRTRKLAHPIPINPEIEAKLWAGVEKGEPDECWNWIRGTRNGYGSIKHHYRPYGAHRVSFAIAFGDPDPNQVVRHTCDNPRCCNPNHLLAGTIVDNNRDARERSNIRRRIGEENENAVLTESIVEAIWELRRKTGHGRSRISRVLGVSSEAVGKVLCGKSWRHLTPEWALESK